jgi:hypothetical protein
VSLISHIHWLVLLDLMWSFLLERLPGKEGVAEPQAKMRSRTRGLYLGQSESEQVLVYCVAMFMLSTTSFALCSLRNPASYLPMICRSQAIVSSVAQNTCVQSPTTRFCNEMHKTLEHACTFINHISYPMPMIEHLFRCYIR